MPGQDCPLSRELRPSFLGFGIRDDVSLRVPAFFSLSFQVVNHLATLAVGICSTFTLCGSIGGPPVFFWPFRQRSRWSRFFLSHFLSSGHHPVDLKGRDCYCCFCYHCYLALFLDFIWLPRKTLFGSANHPLIPIIVLLDMGLVSFVVDSRAPMGILDGRTSVSEVDGQALVGVVDVQVLVAVVGISTWQAV